MINYILNELTLKNFIGILLTISGIFDSIKYHWASQKIRQVKTAKGQSRKGINAAIINDGIRIGYCFLIKDIYLIISSILAMICMLECFYTIYTYYPYRMRGCYNFKKPNIFLYLINSILPNSIRKRL